MEKITGKYKLFSESRNSLPSTFVLCELKLYESKRGVEAELDQSEVPAKRFETFYRKDQLLSRG